MMMKKILSGFIFFLVLISCNNNAKSEPKFDFPEYSQSEENFTKSIKEADSVNVEIQYESKSNLVSSSKVNKLLIKAYYSEDKNLDDGFFEKQFEQINESAKKQILNYSDYDVFEFKIFKNNTQFKSYEKVIE